MEYGSQQKEIKDSLPTMTPQTPGHPLPNEVCFRSRAVAPKDASPNPSGPIRDLVLG